MRFVPKSGSRSLCPLGVKRTCIISDVTHPTRSSDVSNNEPSPDLIVIGNAIPYLCLFAIIQNKYDGFEIGKQKCDSFIRNPTCQRRYHQNNTRWIGFTAEPVPRQTAFKPRNQQKHRRCWFYASALYEATELVLPKLISLVLQDSLTEIVSLNLVEHLVRGAFVQTAAALLIGSELDVVQTFVVLGEQAFGFPIPLGTPTIPTRLEFRTVFDCEQQIKDSIGICVATHETDTGDSPVLTYQIEERFFVKLFSRVIPQILAVTSRTMVRTIGDTNAQIHFVRNLRKGYNSVYVFQHFGSVFMIINRIFLLKCILLILKL